MTAYVAIIDLICRYNLISVNEHGVLVTGAEIHVFSGLHTVNIRI